jgi:hypothetical protein
MKTKTTFPFIYFWGSILDDEFCKCNSRWRWAPPFFLHLCFAMFFLFSIEVHLLQSSTLLSKFILHICFAPCLCKFVHRAFPSNMMPTIMSIKWYITWLFSKCLVFFLNVVHARYCTCLSIFELRLLYCINHMFTLEALWYVCNSQSSTIMM